MNVRHSVLICLASVIGLLSGDVTNKTTLNVGCLFELSKYRYRDYIQLLPHILDYAFQKIHRDTDLLPDYHFNVIIKDTRVNIVTFLYATPNPLSFCPLVFSIVSLNLELHSILDFRDNFMKLFCG